MLQLFRALNDNEMIVARHDRLGFLVDLAIDAEDGRVEVPIVECSGAESSFGIFGRLGVLNADELRVDAVAEFEGEEEEGAGGHDGCGG